MLSNFSKYIDWLTRIISSESKLLDQLDFIFCDDDYLLKVNQEYLKHDTYTDIITFDYNHENFIAGDVFISVTRVRENAIIFSVDFVEELHRVMAHGVLHLLGYSDHLDDEIVLMRHKEEEKMKMFHVEQ